jgi:hypothetical protein
VITDVLRYKRRRKESEYFLVVVEASGLSRSSTTGLAGAVAKHSASHYNRLVYILGFLSVEGEGVISRHQS